MKLIDLIRDKYQVVSVVGMAKNAGKTVTLNEIIQQSIEEGIPLGLTSIGRDGEETDLVTCTNKPSIYVESGTLIATTDKLYDCADIQLEILEMTEFQTALGTVLIARAVDDGHVQLAGPSIAEDVQRVSRRMLEHGATLVIVDGALDRVSSASPQISDATVLATGAVMSRDMNKVIELSLHQVSLFQLQAIDDTEIISQFNQMIRDKSIRIADIDEGKMRIESIKLRTALGAGKKIADALNEKSRYILIPGSLVEKTLFDIATYTKYFSGVTFVVWDATRIFIQPKAWQLLVKKGLCVQVVEPIELVAVTVNPFSPLGYYFQPETFRGKLQKYLEPLPVIDVIGGDPSVY